MSNQLRPTRRIYKSHPQASTYEHHTTFSASRPRKLPTFPLSILLVSLSYHHLLMSTPRGYTSFPSSADLFYFCTTSSTSEEELNLHYAPPSKSSLKIGVIVLGNDQVQLLDLAVVDLLAKIGRTRMGGLNAPSTTLDEAVDELDVRYVSESGEGSFPITSGARMPVTVS